MKSVAIVLENGFEEIEAITPYDLLNRAGIKCDLVSTKSNEVTGAHGINIGAKLISSFDNYDMIVLPGGMPGAKNLSENEIVLDAINDFADKDKFIAAICASPALVLTKTNVIEGKKVTCYPGMEVVDGKIITSQGPATSIDFALALIEALGGDAKSLSEGILY